MFKESAKLFLFQIIIFALIYLMWVFKLLKKRFLNWVSFAYTWLLGDYLYIWNLFKYEHYSEDCMKLPVKQVWIRIRLGTWGFKFFFLFLQYAQKVNCFFFCILENLRRGASRWLLNLRHLKVFVKLTYLGKYFF